MKMSDYLWGALEALKTHESVEILWWKFSQNICVSVAV